MTAARTPVPEPLPYWTRCFPNGRTIEVASKHQEWTHEACNRIMAHDALVAERDALRECLDTIANELQVWNSGGNHRSASWPESRIKRIRAALAGGKGE